MAPDADAGRRENQDLIRPGSEGPPRRHQMAITGSQIAQPSDECEEIGGAGPGECQVSTESRRPVVYLRSGDS